METTEAKEVTEIGVKAEKLEEVEKLIVIDNEAMVADHMAKAKKKPKDKKGKPAPETNGDTSMQMSVEEIQSEAEFKTEKKELFIEEKLSESEIPGKQKAKIPVEDGVEEPEMKAKAKVKQSWEESETE